MDYEVTYEELRAQNKIRRLFKDALERDMTRKCDKIYAAAMMSSELENFKHLQAIAGDHVGKDVLATIKASFDKKKRREAASSSTSRSSTSSGTSSASTNENDEEVHCVGERTLAQRNAEGFANAIELEDNEEELELLRVHVLPPKEV